jgi:tetratricopeptide (TPR) repeat protein
MRTKLIHILFVLGSLISTFQAQDAEVYNLAMEGLDYVINLEYEQALRRFDQMIERDPKNPQGYFLKSAAYFWSFSSDMHNENLGEKFEENSFKAIDVANNKLKKNKNDIDALFYLGGTYGCLGRYHGLRKSYLKAYWYGKKGVNYLYEVLEIDSTYYDAYLGLGIYNYLADVLPKFVKMLSFILGISGDKDLGIKQIQLAHEKGVLTKTEALFFLGAIYTYREKEYEQALVVWKKLYEKYPQSPNVLIHLGRCYVSLGECERAIQLFEPLLTNPKTKLLPVSNIHYQLGYAHFKANNFLKATNILLKSIEVDSLYSGDRSWTYFWAHYWLGISYEMLDKPKLAKRFYEKIKKGDDDWAIRSANNRLNDPMQDIDKKLYMVKNYIDCRKYDEAIKILNSDILNSKLKEISNVQKLKKVNYYLGEINYKKGNYTEAVSIFNDLLVDQTVKDPWVKDWSHFWRGNCFLQLKDSTRAKSDFMLVLKTEDENLKERLSNMQEILNGPIKNKNTK